MDNPIPVLVTDAGSRPLTELARVERTIPRRGVGLYRVRPAAEEDE